MAEEGGGDPNPVPSPRTASGRAIRALSSAVMGWGHSLPSIFLELEPPLVKIGASEKIPVNGASDQLL